MIQLLQRLRDFDPTHVISTRTVRRPLTIDRASQTVDDCSNMNVNRTVNRS